MKSYRKNSILRTLAIIDLMFFNSMWPMIWVNFQSEFHANWNQSWPRLRKFRLLNRFMGWNLVCRRHFPKISNFLGISFESNTGSRPETPENIDWVPEVYRRWKLAFRTPFPLLSLKDRMSISSRPEIQLAPQDHFSKVSNNHDISFESNHLEIRIRSCYLTVDIIHIPLSP